jgi:outer membrane receptor protein involved in Fe transport
MRRIGIEIDFSTEPVEGLTFNTSYTFSDFKYEIYEGSRIDSLGQVVLEDYSENVLPAVPKDLYSSTISYVYNFTKSNNAFINLNHKYAEKMFVNDKNDKSLVTSSYHLFNSELGINIKLKKLAVLAFVGVNNITDQSYVSYVQVNADSRRNYYSAGAGRNFFAGLQLSLVFKKK